MNSLDGYVGIDIFRPHTACGTHNFPSYGFLVAIEQVKLQKEIIYMGVEIPILQYL